MLAEKMGLKNGRTASVTFYNARRKLINHAEGATSGAKTPSPAKSSPNKVTKKTAGPGRKSNGSPTKSTGMCYIPYPPRHAIDLRRKKTRRNVLSSSNLIVKKHC